jgi:O-acetyl-ADP-ribose deacetylase (regulator of RNase III)
MYSFLDGRVIAKVGDLTLENVDAIVNAANSTLLGGGGVDGAIHDAGGNEILEECVEIRRTRFPDGLPTGQAVITTGGRLPARYVIHTVGPIYGSDKANESKLLAKCYRNSIELAVENSLRSIAFPSISTGAYSYPRDKAAVVSTSAVRDSLAASGMLVVRRVFDSDKDLKVFLENCRFEAKRGRII